jgi:hypothetical protein
MAVWAVFHFEKEYKSLSHFKLWESRVDRRHSVVTVRA